MPPWPATQLARHVWSPPGRRVPPLRPARRTLVVGPAPQSPGKRLAAVPCNRAPPLLGFRVPAPRPRLRRFRRPHQPLMPRCPPVSHLIRASGTLRGRSGFRGRSGQRGEVPDFPRKLEFPRSFLLGGAHRVWADRIFISVTGWVLPGAADNLVGEDAADGPQSGVGPARTVLANAPRRLHPLWWQSRNGL